MIKGQNSSPKALFTTMLSALPPSRIHRAVFNASADNPNDFKWVVDDLSEAGKLPNLAQRAQRRGPRTWDHATQIQFLERFTLRC